MRLLLFAVIGAAPATAGEIALTMAGSEYAPTVVEASVGDVLRFVNDELTKNLTPCRLNSLAARSTPANAPGHWRKSS